MATLNAKINDKDIQTVTVSATPGINVGLIQRGEKGVSIKSIEQTKISTESSGTNEVTVTLDNGTRSTFEVSNGKKGEKGDKGDSGTDGISPVVSINKSGKSTTIQITDVNGTHTAIINDGIDGKGVGDMLKSEYDKNNDGIIDNAEKVNGHTVESDVPANAKFTDTTYANATQESDGIMSKEDKQKLDSLSNYDDTTIKEEINTKADSSNVYTKTETDTRLNKMDEGIANAVEKSDLLNLIYPVGSIYMSVNSTNPATLFGGTWEQIKGRFLLGAGRVEANTNNFWGKLSAGDVDSPLGELGGEAMHELTQDEMPSHRHQLTDENGEGPGLYPNWGTNSGWGVSSQHLDGNGGIVKSALTGGGQRHNNMPPYLVVTIWKRIA